MTTESPSPYSAGKSPAGPSALTSLACLFGFLIVVFIVGWAGGAVTATSVGDWYETLAKPPLNRTDGSSPSPGTSSIS